MVDVSEVIEKPLDQVMGVLAQDRNAIELEGVTRIVGYYSRVNNWNASKVGEQRDRIKGRKEGAYGFSGVQESNKAIAGALDYVDKLQTVIN